MNSPAPVEDLRSLQFGRLEICPSVRQLRLDGKTVTVGARAFDVLQALAERHGRVVGKDELIEAAWPGLVVEENNLAVQISGLRKLLGPEFITTVTGRGYRLTALCTPEAAPAASAPVAVAMGMGMGTGMGTGMGSLALATASGKSEAVRAVPLFGRDADLQQLCQACMQHTLVTLCGAGGIGKTCLARAAAGPLAAHFSHGVHVVELAALARGDLVVPTVAHGLGVVLQGHNEAAEELAAALQNRHLLLVLDNCEHLLDTVAPLVHRLLLAAPQVTVLATSQEPLHLAGEHVLRLGPLGVPAVGEWAAAQQFGAVRLFVERVRGHLSQFQPSPAELEDAVEICRQLDGIALAIELAAARVPLLGVAGVRSRLGERLTLLTAGTRAAPSRHQTLRAALEWSHQLLPPTTQVVLRRLGVFSGGFVLESAQRVVGDLAAEVPTEVPAEVPTEVPAEVQAEGGVRVRLEEVAMLDHLAVLVDRCMLTVESGPKTRYGLLESMRAFALERLQEAGEEQAWQRRHAVAMGEICQLATRQRNSAWLWAEMNNGRAALDWALAMPGHGALAVTIASHLSVVLAVAGPVPQAADMLQRVQHLVDEHTPPRVAAKYWQWVGRFGSEGRLPSSRCIEALQRAASLFSAAGSPRHLHGCKRMLAEACMRAGDLAAAQQHLHAAAQIEAAAPAATLPADRMRRLRIAALLADACGDHQSALRQVRQALDIAQTHAIQRYCHMLMADLAWIQLRMGEPDAAAARLRELLGQIDPGPKDGLTRAYALAGLTAALVAAGRLVQARAGAVQAVDALRACGIFLARGDIFAWLAAASERPQLAAQLLGASDAFHARGETQRDLISQLAHDEAQRLLSVALPLAELEYWLHQGADAEEAVLAHGLAQTCAGAGAAQLVPVAV